MAQATATLDLPRRSGRPRTFDVSEALDRAIGVFSEDGYHGTPLSKLTTTMGISEGSLYKAFHDKRGVFMAAFERYVELRHKRLERKLAMARSGRDKVKAMLSVYAEYSHGVVGRRGCFIVGMAIELASSDAEMAKHVAAVVATHEKRLVAFLREGQLDGSIPSGIDVATTARLMYCVMQGMRVLGKIGQSHRQARALVDAALRLLN